MSFLHQFDPGYRGGNEPPEFRQGQGVGEVALACAVGAAVSLATGNPFIFVFTVGGAIAGYYAKKYQIEAARKPLDQDTQAAARYFRHKPQWNLLYSVIMGGLHFAYDFSTTGGASLIFSALMPLYGSVAGAKLSQEHLKNG